MCTYLGSSCFSEKKMFLKCSWKKYCKSSINHVSSKAWYTNDLAKTTWKTSLLPFVKIFNNTKSALTRYVMCISTKLTQWKCQENPKCILKYTTVKICLQKYLVKTYKTIPFSNCNIGWTLSYAQLISNKNVFFFAVPPVISNVHPSHNLTVRKGSTVKLVCNATGFPEPEINWQREVSFI